MKLWKISQNVNNDYDTYDSAVVAAETEEEARNIHPQGHQGWHGGTWAWSPSDVTVEHIGEAKEDTETGVIVASFNAG